MHVAESDRASEGLLQLRLHQSVVVVDVDDDGNGDDDHDDQRDDDGKRDSELPHKAPLLTRSADTRVLSLMVLQGSKGFQGCTVVLRAVVIRNTGRYFTLTNRAKV